MKLSFTPILLAPILFLNLQATAQTTTTPATGGTVFANQTGVGTLAWNDPAGAETSDATFATISDLILTILAPPVTVTSEYLTATGFNFSAIPAGATILGVTATIQHERQTLLTLDVTSNDNIVKLIVGGSIVGTNMASATNWGNSEETFTYGGPTNLWGNTLTLAQVQASNFGIAFSEKMVISAVLGLGLTLTDAVNYISMSVTYSTLGSLPITLQSFSVVRQNNTNVLNWTGSSDDLGDQFIIQRSGDSKTWDNLTTIPAQEASQQYTYTDNTPLNGNNFYRLYLQNQGAQGGTYSPIQEISQQAVAISCYPNPFIDMINISSPNPIHSVTLRDMQGRTILSKVPNASTNTLQLPAGGLPPGIYLVQIDGAIFKLLKQ
jgi:type IX secretion system substrate protein